MLLTPNALPSVKVAQSLIISLPHELQQSGEFPFTAFGCHTDPKLTSSASTSEGSLSLRAARGDHR